jgi:hypothetical protein
VLGVGGEAAAGVGESGGVVSPFLPERSSRGEMVYVRTTVIEALDDFSGETLSDRILTAIDEARGYQSMHYVENVKHGEAAAEVERLRAILTRAPHVRSCEASASFLPGRCTCWKRRVAQEEERAS